jgi:hypothetical protein
MLVTAEHYYFLKCFEYFFQDSISVAIVTHCRRYQPCSCARYSSSRPMLVFHWSMTRWLKNPQLIQSETSHRIIEVVLMSPTNGATPCFLSLWILSSVIPLCRGSLGLFTWYFPISFLYAFLVSLLCVFYVLSVSSFSDLIALSNILWRVQFISPLVSHFHHLPIASSVVDPNSCNTKYTFQMQVLLSKGQ